MKIKLPMVLELNSEEQRYYYRALNKFIKFEENEKNTVDMTISNNEGIITSGEDTVAMLKIGTDFRDFGSNGSFASDYVFFFNTSIKFTNEDIIKSFLENHRGEFKSMNTVKECLENALYKKYTQNIEIEKIVQELELESPFFKVPKAKLKL